MCIMLTKPAGVKLNRDALRECYDGNPQGCGYAAASPQGNLVLFRDPKISFDKFWDRLQKHEDWPMLIHFRLATHGGVDHENTHPFLFGNYAMAHNGIITCDTKGNESDTRAFIRLGIDPYLKDWPNVIELPEWQEMAQRSIGWSKLAFLRKDGEFFYVNKDTGHEDLGCWWSNGGYKPRRLPLGYSHRWMDEVDDFDLADRIYEERMRRKSSHETIPFEEAKDESASREYFADVELAMREDTLDILAGNIVMVDDCVCTVCSEFCNPPYFLDVDTGATVCQQCQQSFAPNFNPDEPFNDEEECEHAEPTGTEQSNSCNDLEHSEQFNT